jgi:hypothetical protein
MIYVAKFVCGTRDQGVLCDIFNSRPGFPVNHPLVLVFPVATSSRVLPFSDIAIQ